MAKKRVSATLAAYRRLQRTKKGYCQGEKTKSDVNAAKKDYIDKAVKKGQTRKEATQKADRVVKGGCKMSSVAGRKKKK